MYDIIIIGAGPAGLTAAIYARRSEKSVLMLERAAVGGQMTYSPKIENYPGFAAASGNEIADAMVTQAMELGAEIELEEVTEVADGSAPDYIKTVKCESGAIFEARAVIIAAGAEHRRLGVPGEAELVGEGVSFCAVCDGAFYRGRDVAVIGGGNSALGEALMLADGCKSVTILQNLDFLTGEKSQQNALLARENVKVICGVTVERFIAREDGGFGGVTVKHAASGETEDVVCDGAFVAVGLEPKNTLFEPLTSLDENGYIMSDETCVTETPGVFVAGDCRTKSVRQITTAAADGAVAAISACRYLG